MCARACMCVPSSPFLSVCVYMRHARLAGCRLSSVCLIVSLLILHLRPFPPQTHPQTNHHPRPPTGCQHLGDVQRS